MRDIITADGLTSISSDIISRVSLVVRFCRWARFERSEEELLGGSIAAVDFAQHASESGRLSLDTVRRSKNNNFNLLLD